MNSPLHSVVTVLVAVLEAVVVGEVLVVTVLVAELETVDVGEVLVVTVLVAVLVIVDVGEVLVVTVLVALLVLTSQQRRICFIVHKPSPPIRSQKHNEVF